MSDNCMEVLSKGRYEENRKELYSPSRTPDSMAQSLSLTRLSSAEPYFVLNSDENSLDHNDALSTSSACDSGGEMSACKASLSHATSGKDLSSKGMVDRTGEGRDSGELNFYSWVQSKTGTMEAMLKSYISTHYGLCSAGKKVGNVADIEKEEGKDEHQNDEEESEEECDSCSSNVSDGDLEDSASLQTTTDGSLGHFEFAEQGSQRFTDPLTQKAYEKMLALDEKLMKVVKREKEVKRQRRQLEETMKEEGINLALIDGLSTGTDRGSCVSPLFPTQPTEASNSTVKIATEKNESNQDNDSIKEDCTRSAEEKEKKTKKTKKAGSQEYAERDFIKRNIELVADAGSLVKMTNAEKNRLKELLDDNDDENVLEGKGSDEINNSAVVDSVRPLPEIMDRPFAMDTMAMERLREIHSKLEAVSGTKIGAICYSPSSSINTPTAASNSEQSTFLSQSTFEGRSPDHKSTACHSGEGDNDNGGKLGATDYSRDVGDSSNGYGQEVKDNLCSDAGSTYDEGDVVLECMETAGDKGCIDTAAAGTCDGDFTGCSNSSGSGGSGGVCQKGGGNADCIKRQISNEHDKLPPEEVQQGSFGSTSTVAPTGPPGFIGRGVLAKDCLSTAEREKLSLLDEKLLQLHEESDLEYLSKKPLSSEQLKFLLEECKDSEGDD